MSRDRPSLGTAGTSRRHFLRGAAGLSLGATSLGGLTACQARPAKPASKRLPLIGYLAGYDEAERANTAALREGLTALGYRERQTI